MLSLGHTNSIALPDSDFMVADMTTGDPGIPGTGPPSTLKYNLTSLDSFKAVNSLYSFLTYILELTDDCSAFVMWSNRSS